MDRAGTGQGRSAHGKAGQGRVQPTREPPVMTAVFPDALKAPSWGIAAFTRGALRKGKLNSCGCCGCRGGSGSPEPAGGQLPPLIARTYVGRAGGQAVVVAAVGSSFHAQVRAGMNMLWGSSHASDSRTTPGQVSVCAPTMLPARGGDAPIHAAGAFFREQVAIIIIGTCREIHHALPHHQPRPNEPLLPVRPQH